jgi:hypothetical protein
LYASVVAFLIKLRNFFPEKVRFGFKMSMLSERTADEREDLTMQYTEASA